MKIATEIMYNQILENRHLTMMPPLRFGYDSMHPDYLKARRTQKAINAQIKYGGKFFCWHDYTYISEVVAMTVFEAGTSFFWYKYLCTKCGKETHLNSIQHNAYIENLLN